MRTEKEPEFVRLLRRLNTCYSALEWIEEAGFNTLQQAYDGLDQLSKREGNYVYACDRAVAWLWWLAGTLTGNRIALSMRAEEVWGAFNVPVEYDYAKQFTSLAKVKAEIPVPTMKDLRQAVRVHDWELKRKGRRPPYPWEVVKTRSTTMGRRRV